MISVFLILPCYTVLSCINRHNRGTRTDEVDAVGLHADATVSGSDLLFFPEKPFSVQGENGIEGEFLEAEGQIGRII